MLPHPLADDEPEVPDDDPRRRSNGTAPGPWCPWVPSTDGCALTFDGAEKAYNSVRWLDYLIRTFLAPGAEASALADPQFADFTFDHLCDGAVAACRRDTGRVSVIFVTDNEVDDVELMPGIPEGAVWAALPYEADVDRSRQRMAVRRAAYDPRLVDRVRI